ncbi:hypothetical protein [Nitrincola tapanii]|uniref:Uncharacterized protein n=1 Tax=Nitrincola tapanii TaxID=1708751 RepID=A0A5A9W1K9_9GAMM|nr:hypothetical protein [Nitrincola tapanii]KAA0874617.1 hypothetical protein E1H14_07250 [Nitrincola tapanii]
MQSSSWLCVRQALIRFFLLVLAMLWVPLAVFIDVEWVGHGMPERGFTEISQELLIFLSSALFVVLAVKLTEQRGLMVLVAGFFLSMFIRELDALFDYIRHGFWKYPVALVVTISLAVAAFYRQQLLPSMAAATRSAGFAYILAGIAILLVFSRVFGTSSFWTAILDSGVGVAAPALVKNVVQEGLELLAYVLIFYGATGVYLEHFPLTRRDNVDVS